MHRIVARATLAAVLGFVQASAMDTTDDYRIGPYDVLDVSVWNNDKLSRTVPVRPDGKISLPLLMDVDAAGLTPVELRDTIVAQLAKHVDAPEVAVIVREVNSVTFAVMGSVLKPGRFPLRGRLTVVEALAQAGGFTDFASPRQIFVLRPNTSGDRVVRIPYDYKKQVLNNYNRAPLYLRSGDVVIVP